MRRIGLIRIAAACLTLVLGAGSAAAATPRRLLTQAEYQQLLAARKRVISLSDADAQSRRRAQTICVGLHRVSPLVSQVRAGCLDLLTLAGDHDRLNAAATRCGIDPPSEGAILTCLVPAFRTYAANARTFELAETSVARILRDRGFGRACLTAIGVPPRNLAAEGRLASDLSAVVKGLRAQNPDALQSLSGRVSRDVRAITPATGSLAACPHA